LVRVDKVLAGGSSEDDARASEDDIRRDRDTIGEGRWKESAKYERINCDNESENSLQKPTSFCIWEKIRNGVNV
jgi:hypothetical protein